MKDKKTLIYQRKNYRDNLEGILKVIQEEIRKFDAEYTRHG